MLLEKCSLIFVKVRLRKIRNHLKINQIKGKIVKIIQKHLNNPQNLLD